MSITTNATVVLQAEVFFEMIVITLPFSDLYTLSRWARNNEALNFKRVSVGKLGVWSIGLDDKIFYR